MSQFAPLSLSVKSTLAASTVPAMVYLGYLMKSKYDQSYNNNSNDYGPSNNNNNKNRSDNNSDINKFDAPQQTFDNFDSQLQKKLHEVQRRRLDPIEEEKEYWH